MASCTMHSVCIRQCARLICSWVLTVHPGILFLKQIHFREKTKPSTGVLGWCGSLEWHTILCSDAMSIVNLPCAVGFRSGDSQVWGSERSTTTHPSQIFFSLSAHGPNPILGDFYSIWWSSRTGSFAFTWIRAWQFLGQQNFSKKNCKSEQALPFLILTVGEIFLHTWYRKCLNMKYEPVLSLCIFFCYWKSWSRKKFISYLFAQWSMRNLWIKCFQVIKVLCYDTYLWF